MAATAPPGLLTPAAGDVVQRGRRLGVPMTGTRAVRACAPMLDERRRKP